MINQIILMGRLVRDPELTKAEQDLSIVRFTLAYDTLNQGEKASAFIDCKAFRKTADTIYKFCRKGKQVIVSGSLTQRTYVTKDNVAKKVFEIVVSSIELLGTKSDAETPTATPTPSTPKPKESANLDSIGVNDDDLPF